MFHGTQAFPVYAARASGVAAGVCLPIWPRGEFPHCRPTQARPNSDVGPHALAATSARRRSDVGATSERTVNCARRRPALLATSVRTHYHNS